MDERSLNRRSFLRYAALGAGSMMIPRALRATPARAVVPSLVGALDRGRLVGPHALWEWQEMMVGLGPRFTGSPQQQAYVDFLEQECLAAGLTTSHDPTQYLPFWEADHTQCALSIAEGGGSFTDLDVMSYFPCSGNTRFLPGGALTAEIVDVGQGLPQDFAAGIATGSLRGKIAFCTFPRFRSTDVVAYPYYYNNDPDMTMLPTDEWNTWALSILAPQALATPGLAQQAGCAGVVFALEATARCALGQYISFLGARVVGDQANGEPGLPILYVDYRTGELLRSRLSALGSRTTARLVLPSTTHPGSGADQLVAVLPGASHVDGDWSSDEIVLLASHTDGISASEENGPLAMLAIAKYFAAVPQSQRRRTLVFAFAAGHMSGYTEDMQWFVDHHPEILASTAATMTLEHLGQRSWTDDPQANTFTDDGYSEMGVSYVSQDPLLIQSVIANYQTENLQRAPVLNGPGFGVSIPLFGQLDLPCYAFITGPNSLYQMDQATVMEITDPDRLHQELRAFVRILQSWEGLSRDELSAGKSSVGRLARG